MLRVGLVVIVLSVVARVASADDYPLGYADRPLALPSTDAPAIEGMAALRWFRQTSFAFDGQAYNAELLDAAARAAYSRIELSISTELLLHQIDELANGAYFPRDRLAVVAGGARIAITPGVQIGADITRFGSGAYPGLSDTYFRDVSRALVAARLHLAPDAAIQLTAFAGYARYPTDRRLFNDPTSAIVLGAEVRAIAQVHPQLAIEARFAFVRIDPDLKMYPTSYADLTEDYGLRAIGSVSRVLDIIVDMNFPLEGIKQFTVGAAYRGLP